MDEEVTEAVAADATVVRWMDLGGPFTIDEVDRIEGLSDVPVSRWFDGETLEAGLRRAIVFVRACRDSDDVTMADAGAVLMVTPTPESRARSQTGE